MNLLAVDPGIRVAGVALFLEGKLVKASYIKNHLVKGNKASECFHMAYSIYQWFLTHMLSGEERQLALEWPQVYTSSKGDPNDLLALAGVGSALAAQPHWRQVHCFLPKEWKGQMSKDVCHSRIKDRLSDDEKNVEIEAPAYLEHNVLDAIGIGLFSLGRLTRKRAEL